MSSLLRFLDCRSLPTQATAVEPPSSVAVAQGGASAVPPPPGTPLSMDPAWDPPTLISCAIYAAAHLLAHRTFAIAFVRRKGLQVLNSIVTRVPVVATNEVGVQALGAGMFVEAGPPHGMAWPMLCNLLQRAV